jgi:uncharacterized protein YjbJ (UPF0337 family)
MANDEGKGKFENLKEEAKGKFENLKGRAKQAAGSVTGDKSLEAEGLGERVKGAVEEKVGEIKRKTESPPADDDDES